MSTTNSGRSSEGLSPIFASLLILGVVTVLFIPIFMWTTGLTAGTQSFWELSGTSAQERIVIEVVDLKGGRALCSIYVRSIGKTAVVIADVLIVPPSGAIYTFDKTTFTTYMYTAGNPAWVQAQSPGLVQGDLVKIEVNLQPTPAAGQTYTVKVFTERGAGDSYQVVG